MRNSTPRKAVLLVSGLVASAIGAVTLLAPAVLHELNGAGAVTDASSLSETRAAGGALLAIGVVIALGAFVPRLASTAAAAGALVYLSYGLSRLLGIALDGMPVSGLVVATGVELLLGLACAALLLRSRRGAAASPR